MKKPLFIFIFLLLCVFNSRGQNLVPNGGFEQYSACPTTSGQITNSLFWTNPAGYSPDYANYCGTSPMQLPDCAYGYQVPHGDSAIVGIALWYPGGMLREYIQTSLTSPLVAGQCYHFEMYVNFSNNNIYSTDNIDVYFSNTLLFGLPDLTSFTPHISNTTGFMTDTLNWTLISGNYTAAGGESYIEIGNMHTDANTDTAIYNLSGSFSFVYVYIDDVSLSPCTGIEEQNQNDAITIYPNPVKDELIVNSKQFGEKTEIIITDVLGKEIYQSEIKTSNFKLQTSNYLPGIYFIEINDGKNIFRKKFLKAD